MKDLSLLRFPISYAELVKRITRDSNNSSINQFYELCGFDQARIDLAPDYFDGVQANILLDYLREFITQNESNERLFFENFTLTLHGLLGLALLTASSLRESLKLIQHYIEQNMPAFRIGYEIDNELCTVMFYRVVDFERNNDFATEIVMGVSSLIPNALNKSEFFSCNIRITYEHNNRIISIPWPYGEICYQMNAGSNSITFPERLLDMAFTTKNEFTFRELEQQLQAKQQKIIKDKPFMQRVRELLQQDVRKRNSVGLTDIAGLLNVSNRTLNRKLQEEGVKFQALLMQVKMEEGASLLLKTNHRIKEIALDLGYSSEANFSKAFKVFYGVSPTDFREK